MTAVGNKIRYVSSLVKKIDYNAKISEIEKKVTGNNHDKCITTSECNSLTVKKFAARLAQANLVIKRDFDTKLISLNKKINSNKKKTFTRWKWINKTKSIWFKSFKDKNHFEEDDNQNYLVFQPMYKYFEKIGNTDNISEWKSIGLSDEISDNTLAPELVYYGQRMYVKFNGSFLKQDKVTFNHGKIVNIYIVSTLKSTLIYD